MRPDDVPWWRVISPGGQLYDDALAAALAQIVLLKSEGVNVTIRIEDQSKTLEASNVKDLISE